MVIHLVEEFSSFESNSLVIHTEKWAPPPEGWLKGNIDVAFKEERVDGALVLQNSKGDIMRILSQIPDYEIAFLVDLHTLKWALELADSLGWTNISWSSNAAIMVKEIFFEAELKSWSSRDVIFLLRSNLSGSN